MTTVIPIGLQAVFNMMITIVFIFISWWAFQKFKFDLLIQNIHSAQAKALQVLISIAVGYTVARFFIDYLEWAIWLRYLF